MGKEFDSEAPNPILAAQADSMYRAAKTAMSRTHPQTTFGAKEFANLCINNQDTLAKVFAMLVEQAYPQRNIDHLDEITEMYIHPSRNYMSARRNALVLRAGDFDRFSMLNNHRNDAHRPIEQMDNSATSIPVSNPPVFSNNYEVETSTVVSTNNQPNSKASFTIGLPQSIAVGLPHGSFNFNRKIRMYILIHKMISREHPENQPVFH